MNILNSDLDEILTDGLFLSCESDDINQWPEFIRADFLGKYKSKLDKSSLYDFNIESRDISTDRYPPLQASLFTTNPHEFKTQLQHRMMLVCENDTRDEILNLLPEIREDVFTANSVDHDFSEQYLGAS